MMIKVNHLSFKLAAFVIVLCLEDINTSYVWDPKSIRDNRNEYFHINQREHERNYSEKQNPERFPLTKTQYFYKNHQTGSVMVPRGGKQHVSPDHNKTVSYTAKVETTIYGPKKQTSRKTNNHHLRHTDFSRRLGFAKYTAEPTSNCIKCPSEKTVIAQKGLDGALIEMPRLFTCKNQPISLALYEIKTLFSPKSNFILPQSKDVHSFIGRIVNKKTGTVVQSCLLKYKVIVRQCPKYYPKNKDLKTVCDLGNIWGSKCTFHCKNDGYLIEEDAAITCGDNMTWEGKESRCMYNSISEDYPYDSDATYSTSACELPIPPDNGRFSCELKSVENSENDLNVPDGTICRIKCNRHFDIPRHLHAKSTFSCQSGQWNSTMTQFCQKTRRRH